MAEILPSADPGIKSISYIEASKVVDTLRAAVREEDVFQSLQFYVNNHGTFVQRAEGSVRLVDTNAGTEEGRVKGQIVEREVRRRDASSAK